MPNQHENASCSVRTAVSALVDGRGPGDVGLVVAETGNMMKRRYDEDHVVFDGRGVGDGGPSGSATESALGAYKSLRKTSLRVTVRRLRSRMTATSCGYTWVTGRWLRWPITMVCGVKYWFAILTM